MLPGVPTSTGGVVSRTVTVNEARQVFVPSVAEQLTVVTPNRNVAPEAGRHVGVNAPAIKSVADAENVTTAPEALVASATMLAGTVTVGAVVSATTTLNVPVARFPDESVAVHVTGVVPIGNVLPDALLQTTATAPSALSVAVTA